jgi:hypothetical protein
MNLINEFKMSFRKYLVPFYQSEIKEAYGTIYEINRNIEKDINAYCIWPLISNKIESKLILNPKWFIKSIEKNNLTPREAIFLMCFNYAKDELAITDIFELSKRDGLETAMEFFSIETSKIKIQSKRDQ